MHILPASARPVYHEPPTDADRAWWRAQNDSWHDPDGPPVMEAHVAIGGRYRRVNVDTRPDLYGDPLEPEGHEWHFGY